MNQTTKTFVPVLVCRRWARQIAWSTAVFVIGINGAADANQLPVANADSYETAEDTPLNVAVPGVLGNDTDGDGDPLTAVLATDVSDGVLNLASDGSFSYTPNTGFSGADSFTYLANDGTGDSPAAAVQLTVTPINQLPVANADSYETAEDTPLNVAVPGVLGNDTDGDGDPLTAVLATDVSDGVLNLASDGSFSYTPNAGFTDIDSFSYVANDGTGNSPAATVQLTVIAANQLPVANGDSFETAEDTPLNVAVPGVLGNDTDGDGDPLTAVLATDVSDGVLNLAADGSFSYTPNAGFRGADSFTYLANDGTGDSPAATVQLTVAAANQSPVANAGSVRAGDGLPLDITLEFSDPDGPGPFVFTVVQEPVNGVLGSDDGDATITYTSTPGFIGTDSIQFRVNDGEFDSNVAEVTIHVQHYPGQAWETRTPESLGLRSRQLDEFATRVGGFGTIVKDGFVVKAWGNQTVKVDWASAAKPVLSNLLFFAVDEQKIASTDELVQDWVPIATGGSLSPDDQTLTFAQLANNTSGYARAEAPGERWAYNDIAVNLYALLLEAVFGETLDTVVVSRLADLQFEDGSLFTSRNGYGISTSVRDFARITWFWLNKGSWGGIQILPETFFDQFMRPQVAADLPLSQDSDADYLNVGSYGGGSNQTLFGPGIYGFHWWYNDFVGTTTDLAWPDAPPGMIMASGRFGLEMAIVLPSLNMVISHQGDWGSFDPGDPASGVNQSLKLIVQSAIPPGANTPPTSVSDSYSVAANQSLTVASDGVLANDTDADGDDLTAVLAGDAGNGTIVLNSDGGFTYTPSTNFTGVDSFSYLADDGLDFGVETTVQLTVTVGNQLPVANADSYETAQDTPLNVPAPGVLGNDTDGDGDPLTAVLVTDVSDGILNLAADGSFSYTPNTGFSGTDSFSYTANDGTGDSLAATVQLTVTVGNQLPVANADSYETAQDTPLNVPAPGVLGNDTDGDGDPLTAVLGTDVSDGILNLAADGSFSYTPNTGFSGTDSFSYTANDGTGDSPAATVQLTVTVGNQLPVANADSYETAQDTPLNVAVPGVLGNDTDGDGDPLTAVLATNVSDGVLNLASDGSFSYTPNTGFSGTDSFSYTANDGSGDSPAATVQLTVTAGNQLPVANADSYETAQETPLNVPTPGVLGNDTDGDGDPLTAVLATNVSDGVLNFASDGSFSYTPNTGFSGTDSFSYTANDGTGNSPAATVQLTVTAETPQTVSATLLGDSFTKATVPDRNLDGRPVLWVNDYADQRTFLDFDLSGVSGSSVTQATLEVGIDTVNIEGPVTVHKVLGGWTEGSLTHNNQPSFAAAEAGSFTVVSGDQGGRVSVDVTALVQDWSGNPAGEFGLVLVPGGTNLKLVSKEGGQPASLEVNIGGPPGPNTPPLSVDDSYAVTENQSLSVAAPGVLGNDTDADGNALSAALVTDVTTGTLSLASDGSFSYTPNTGFTGADGFSYQASDGQDLSNVANVQLSVNENNNVELRFDDVSSVLGFSVERESYSTTWADYDKDGWVDSFLNNHNQVPTFLLHNVGGSFEDVATTAGVAGIRDQHSCRWADYDNDGDLDLYCSTGANQGAGAQDANLWRNDGNGSFTDIAAASGVANSFGRGRAVNWIDIDSDGDLDLFVGNDADDSSQQRSLLYRNDGGSFFDATDQINVDLNGEVRYSLVFDYLRDGDWDLIIRLIPSSNVQGFGGPCGKCLVILDNDGNGFFSSIVGSNIGLISSHNGNLALADFDSDMDIDIFTANAPTSSKQLFRNLGNGQFEQVTLSSVGLSGLADSINSNDITWADFDNNGFLDLYLVRQVPSGNSPNDMYLNTGTGSFVDVSNSANVLGPTRGRGDAASVADYDNDGYLDILVSNGQGGASGPYQLLRNQGLQNNWLRVVPVSEKGSEAFGAKVYVETPGLQQYREFVDQSGTLGVDELVAHFGLGTNQAATTVRIEWPGGATSVMSDVAANQELHVVEPGGMPSNQLPVANGDSYETAQGTPLNVPVPGVLGNDTDADGDALTAVLVTDVSGGILGLAADGSFTYTPNSGFSGADSFSYLANDGTGNSAAATVQLTVTPVNQLPVASADSYETAQDTPLIVPAPGVLGNDTDGDGDPLAAVLVTDVSDGILNLAGDGSFSYTPDTGFSGTDSFSYQASDGQGAGNVASVDISVSAVTGNSPPVGTDDNYALPENQSLTIPGPGVLENDTDADGDPLTAVLTSATASGSLVLNSDGGFTYTPNTGFTGTDIFRYRADDGLDLGNEATVQLTVTSANQLPVANADAYETAQEIPLNVPAPGVLGNDTDGDGDPLTAALVSGVADGILNLASDGSFSYTPNTGFSGTDSFSYTANDGTGNSPAATVQLTVTAETPQTVSATLLGDSYTKATVPGRNLDGRPVLWVNDYADQRTFLDFDLSGVFGSSVTQATLEVGIDTVNIEGPVTVHKVLGGWTEGSLTHNNQPSFAAVESGGFTVVPGDEGGRVSVDVTALVQDWSGNPSGEFGLVLVPGGTNLKLVSKEGGQPASLEVDIGGPPGPNTPPLSVDDSYAVTENQSLAVAAPGVLGNDTDDDGDLLTAVLVTDVSDGILSLASDGSFSYTPNTGFTGTDGFSYQASDGQEVGNVASVGITVSAVTGNNPPVAGDDSYTLQENQSLTVPGPGVLQNDTDADGDTLMATLTSAAASGSLVLNSDGGFSYTPNTGFSGADSFRYRADDGLELSNEATVQLTVDTETPGQTVSSTLLGDSYTKATVPDRNLDGRPVLWVNNYADQRTFLDFDLSGVFGSSVTQATLEVGIDTVNIEGPVTVHKVLGGWSEGSLTHNNQPLFAVVESGGFTVVPGDEGGRVSVDVTALVQDWSGNPSGEFGLVLVPGGTNLKLVSKEGGQPASLEVDIGGPPGPNTPPLSVDDSYAVTENQSLAVAAPGVLGNDTDADGDPLTAVLMSDASDGVLSLGSDGSFAYTPNTGFTGSDSFSYQANDGQELSDTATVELIVSAQPATVTVPDLVGLQFAAAVPDGDAAWQVPSGFGAEVALSAERISTTFADIPLVASAKPGQIVVDPQNASWLLHNGDRPLFIAAPGDPEDFLYRGNRNPDGTRSGDQSEIITALKQSGANGLYLMAIRSNGGDGDVTHNPFLANNPELGFNENILHQWELWFSEMDANGIVIVFFIYDDGAVLWDTGDIVGAEEQSFVSELVNRFEHHRNIIWTVAEEYGEQYSVQRISSLAAVIRSADDFDHPIAVHKNESLSLLEFATDPNIDQFSIQYNRPSPQDVHDGMLTAWAEAAGQLNLNLSENSGQGVGDSARTTSWAAAMGGAYVMVLGMDIVASASSDLLDLGALADFMESVPINRMSPQDALAFAGAEWILADPGSSYVAYKADPSTDSLGLRNLLAGVYRLRWLDIQNRVVQVSEAEQLLLDTDLTIGAMIEVVAPLLAEGIVASQSPAAGSLVPPGTKINLEIAVKLGE